MRATLAFSKCHTGWILSRSKGLRITVGDRIDLDVVALKSPKVHAKIYIERVELRFRLCWSPLQNEQAMSTICQNISKSNLLPANSTRPGVRQPSWGTLRMQLTRL